MVSFGNGAFKGYDDIFPLSSDFLIPYQSDWKKKVEPLYLNDGDPNKPRSPQNDCRILQTETVFEGIMGSSCNRERTGLLEVKDYYNQRGGDTVLVANSHYGRGAYWLTWDIPWGGPMLGGTSKIMDGSSWDKLDDYLEGKYKNLLGKRNKVPFSILTVWYLSGLDHEAHHSGMEAYRRYFVNTTDAYIKKMVDKLKELGEFENKIFIIVSDHGMTEMPTNLFYERERTYIDLATGNERTVIDYPPAEMSCSLKLDFQIDPDNPEAGKNKRNAELANNNLHIWELVEVLKTIGENGWGNYRVLSPKEIANLYKIRTRTGQIIELPFGATDDLDKANVVAALNGPIAHIYLKGISGWKDKEVNLSALSELAGYLKAYLMENGMFLGRTERAQFKNLLGSIDTILIREDGIYKIFKGVKTDVSGNITGSDAETIRDTSFDSNKYVSALRRIEGLESSREIW